MANIDEKVVSLDTLSHFKAKQDLLNLQRFQEKGLTDLTGAVRYDAFQVLTEEQKAQARANIGAAAPGEGGGGSTAEGAVLYTAQALTDEQKSQARENIGTTDGTWENMPDKPFYKTGYKYEWDGDITGKEVLTVVEDLDFYLMSSDVLSEDDLLGATVKSYFDGSTMEGEITRDGDFSLVQTSTGNYIVLYSGQLPLAFVSKQAGEDSFGGTTFIIEAKGLWFLHSTGEKEYTQYLQKNYSVKKIDKEFLPDDINVELPENIVTTDENGLIPSSLIPGMFDETVEGYYNEEDNLFYEDAELITPIAGEKDKFYFDKNSTDIYRFGGTIFGIINPKTYTLATTSDIDALFA